MGYMVHHAIIVTSEYKEKIEEAHACAIGIFPEVSDIFPGTANSVGSFFVPPDGSKEGWVHSDDGDERREEFMEYLRGETGLSWAEVQYGDDEGDNKLTYSNAD